MATIVHTGKCRTTVKRRSLIALPFYQTFSSVNWKHPQDGPLSGAIRWDAWYAPGTKFEKAVESSLGPKQFHFRMPFFGRELDDGHVKIDGNRQDVLDYEIDCARRLGLSYWAYCWYTEGSALQNAWNLHQKSSKRDLMNWTAIIQLDGTESADQFRKHLEGFENYFKQPNFQRTLGNKPLLYLNFSFHSKFDLDFTPSKWIGLRVELESFRNAISQSLGQSPYLVIMNPSPDVASALVKAIGGDAISSYAAPVAGGGVVSYRSFAEAVEDFWGKMAATGSHIVPIAMTGWDTRPRQLHPPAWNPTQERGYVRLGTKSEIDRHLAAAAAFVDKNRQVCSAGTYIVYSWNECDEGEAP